MAASTVSHGARRDLKTNIVFADEVKHQQELAAKGGKEDMWQGGDIYYPNPPKLTEAVTIEDISGRESEFTLEKNGFLLGKQHTKVMLATEDLSNTAKIEGEYYPEMEKWLKEVEQSTTQDVFITGAPKVLIFNHATRISDSKFNINDFKKDSKKVAHQAAVFAAHLDQSTWQAGNVLHKYYPDEAETLLRGRFMIVNAWRPIKPVYKHPFGICDASTVPIGDLVIRRNRIFQDVNESMGVIYNANHRWLYKFAQQPEEVLLFKQADNYGKARACPHTAFVDEEFEGREPRESIEIRALLMWPEYEPVGMAKI